MKQLPLGIQSFEKLREGDYLYIDKTESIYNLVTQGSAYFLSRPRRFGKSLLVSTLCELFAGNKSLFSDTWIVDRWDWNVTYPVVHLDFSKIAYKTMSLEAALCDAVDECAAKYAISLKKTYASGKLMELIEQLSLRNQVAVLIDEYDKPIIDYIDDEAKLKENREIIRNFFSILKGSDPYIRFLFLTGVSKFTKVSVFSDINHLTDLTFNRFFSTMLGYTLDEVKQYFGNRISSLSELLGTPEDKLLLQIKEWYNGYSWDGYTRVCNPFSVLSFFASGEFRDYWFETGTPSYLIKLLRTNRYSPQDLDNSVVGLEVFSKYDLPTIDIKSLFVETGYLTIKERISQHELLLAYPNREVAQSMNSHILSDFVYSTPVESNALLSNMRRALQSNDLTSFERYFQAIWPGLTYHQIEMSEAYFHSIFFLLVKLLGFYIESEVLTNFGRIDCVIKTDLHIYVIEFKKGTSKTALSQIKDRDYHQKYLTDGRPITLLGIGFNHKTRKVSKMAVERVVSN